MPETIATTVRFHRKQAGLTQQQLAELAGVGKTVIYDIEKGKSSIRFNTLCSVLNALNIKLTLHSPLSQREST